MKNVIATSGLSGSLLSNMNAQSSMAMLNAMTLAAQENDELVKNGAHNELVDVKNQLTTRLGELSTELQEVRSLAEILSGDELTQIEAILRQVVDSPRMQALFDSLSITVGSEQYSAKAVLAALATMDKEAEGEFVYDENNTVSAYRMKLAEDGMIITFAATTTDDQNTGLRTVNFATNDFRGVPADFNFVYYTRKTAVQRFGKSFDEVSYAEKSHRNVLLNLMLSAYSSTPDPVPDVDGNGNNTGQPASNGAVI